MQASRRDRERKRELYRLKDPTHMEGWMNKGLAMSSARLKTPHQEDYWKIQGVQNVPC